MSTCRIRLSNSNHEQTKKLALQEGISISQFFASAVAEKLSAIEVERYLTERAARGGKANIARILARVSDVPPEGENQIK